MDDESHPHSTEQLHSQSFAERREHEITRSERSQLAKLAEVLKIADFMAILMVLATFFSAYATWRTAMVTSSIFSVVDRPFLGVEHVAFQGSDTQRSTIAVSFKNFGSIPALDTIVSAHAVVDGKVVRPGQDTMSEMDAGIVLPNVPHFFYVLLPPEKYQAVAAGKSNLQVHVSILYKGPAHVMQLCYFERFAYDFRVGIFQASGGNDRCGTDVF